MERMQFHALLVEALTLSADMAEKALGKSIPRSFLIELHSPRSRGDLIHLDEAVENLYLGNNTFYRIIDVAVKKVTAEKTIAFVRVSGDQVMGFWKTFDPSHLGPFKHIMSSKIESVD